MSARPDIRQLPGAGSAGHPGANPGASQAHNQAYFSRHPPLNARHAPTNYLVDAATAAAAAAGKSMRTTPQPASVAGVPVSLGGLTIGRSSSPASRGAPPSAAYQASGLGQRVLPTADHAGQVRYHLPMHAATNSGGPFGGIRDPAYLRANADRHSERSLGHPTHTTSSGASSAAVAASRLTLSRHPNQPIYNDPAYLRDVAHIHPGLQNFHQTSSMVSNAAISAASQAAAIAAAEVAHKRPRLDLSHPPGPVAGSSSTAQSNSISQPLRIDTRETVKVRKAISF